MTTKAKKDYSQGKIYKMVPIIDHVEGDIYIGSTTKKYLSQRMATHKKDYKTWKAGRTYNTRCYELFEKYGIDNVDIILLECINAKCYDELVSRETYYIKLLNCVNVYLPKNEDRIYNKDKRNEYKILKYNCECGSICGINNKQKHLKTEKHKLFLQSLLM